MNSASTVTAMYRHQIVVNKEDFDPFVKVLSAERGGADQSNNQSLMRSCK